MVLFQNCVWWSRPLTKMAAQLYLVWHRTLWEIHIKTIFSGTSSSIRTKLWWNSHWMILFQNCVRQSRSPTKIVFSCHKIFVFRDRSMIFGMLVHDHKAVCRVPSWPSWDLDIWLQGQIIVFWIVSFNS